MVAKSAKLRAKPRPKNLAFGSALMTTVGLPARDYPERVYSRQNAARTANRMAIARTPAATARRVQGILNARARTARLRRIVKNPQRRIVGPRTQANAASNNRRRALATARSAVRTAGTGLRARTAKKRARLLLAAAAASRPAPAAANRPSTSSGRARGGAATAAVNRAMSVPAAVLAHAVAKAELMALPRGRTPAKTVNRIMASAKERKLRTLARLATRSNAIATPLARRQAMTTAANVRAAAITAGHASNLARRAALNKSIANVNNALKKAMRRRNNNARVAASANNRQNYQNMAKASAAAAANLQKKYNNAIGNLNLFISTRGKVNQAKLARYRQIRNAAKSRMNSITAYTPAGLAAKRQKNINFAAAKQAYNFAVSNIASLSQPRSRSVRMTR